MVSKKKVGIITFHAAENYGAVLQTYALQKFLQGIGVYEVEIIDFDPSKEAELDRIFRFDQPSLFVNLRNVFCALLHYRKLCRRKKKFIRFRNRFLLIGNKKYESEKDLLATPPDEDIYISGSDQVFNPRNKYFKAYFLGFSKGAGRKVAYAPSIGLSSFTDDQEKTIKPYVEDFDLLCCRETSGAEILNKLTDRPVPVVADPIFLLDKTAWVKFSVSPEMKEKYILVFDLNGREPLIRIANEIKSKTGLKIVCVALSPQIFRSFRKGSGPLNKLVYLHEVDKLVLDAGPEEFVGWINGAEYVITDSFHGTAFSILLEKKVYSYIALSRTSSRIRNLLGDVGLEDKVIEGESYKTFLFDKAKDNVGYTNKLSDKIAFSKSYLNRMQLLFVDRKED